MHKNQQKITSFSLLDLQRKIQSADGEVDGLRIDGTDLAQQVQYQLAFIADETSQQLWDPEHKSITQ